MISRLSPLLLSPIQVTVPRKDEQVMLLMMTVFFSDSAGPRISRIDNRLYQAGVILAATHIRDGKLVEFIPEKLPEIVNDPVIKADVSWRLNTAG